VWAILAVPGPRLLIRPCGEIDYPVGSVFGMTLIIGALLDAGKGVNPVGVPEPAIAARPVGRGAQMGPA